MNQETVHPRVTLELSEVIENTEAKSGAAFHRSAPAGYAAQLGIEATNIGSATILSAKKSSNLYFNRVLGLDLASPATTEQIDEFVAYYAARKVKRFAVDLSPLAQPGALPDLLVARGFSAVSGPAKLWRDHSPVKEAATEFTIEQVNTDGASAWFDIMGKVFSQFRRRRTWYEARVTAPGSLHYLTDAATLAPFRRRGAQRAMVQRRIRDGLAMGCTWFTSETAAPKPGNPLVSHRNLRRADFEIAYMRLKYVYGKV